MKDTSLAVCLLAVALAAQAGAQTQLDLRTQAKNVDFSAAPSTKPFRTGTLLPGTCSVGETFFKTDAAAGQNLFACTAANTWTLESGAIGIPSMPGNANRVLSTNGTTADWRALGGDLNGAPQAATVTGIQGRPIGTLAPADGQALMWSAGSSSWQPAAGMAAQLGDFAVVRGSPAVLTIGANCSPTTPCNARFGNTVYSFTHSCTATLSSGTGAAFVYVAEGGTLNIGHNLTLAASAGCVAQPNATAFPADSIPLYNWTATSGAWDVTGGRDFRGWLGQKNLLAGTGIATVDSGGSTTVGIDTAVVPTYLTATATLNFPLIADGACAADQSFTLQGAVAGDSVTPGWPAAFEPGLLGSMRVSATNTIAIRVCNLSGAAVDPIDATFRATIVRSF